MRAILLALAGLTLTGCISTLTRSELATEYYNLGNAYFELDRFDESAAFLARALQLDASLARASYNLVRVYAELGRYDDAQSLIEELLTSDPENTLLLESAGYVAFLQSNLPEAARYYDLAIAQSPANATLLRNRATVALLAEEYDVAAQLLQLARELNPDDAELLLDLAAVLEDSGRPLEAVAALREYLVLNDADDTVRTRLATLLAENEFFADAIDVLDGEQAPSAASAFLRASILLTAVGDAPEGITALSTAINLGFRDAEALTELLEDPRLIAVDEVASVIDISGLLADPDSSSDSEETPSASETAEDPEVDAPENADSALPESAPEQDQ